MNPSISESYNDGSDSRHITNHARLVENPDFMGSLLEEYSPEKFKARLFNKIDEFLNLNTAIELKRRLNAIDLKKNYSK